MSAISATSGNNYLSPLQQLQAQLQAEVNSGAVSSSDQDALSSALTDINSSLQGSASSASADGGKPSPADLQSKINDLIAGEVSSGKLTSDQATELQGIFKAAFADGGHAPGGAGGAHHGHHGGHGSHGGSPPAGGSSPADSTGSAADILQQFLQSLQSSLSASSSPSYGATGGSSTGGDGGSSFSALLIDYQT